MPRFDIEPRVAGEVRLGSDKGDNVVWAGRLAERGDPERIMFDGSENFVTLEVGKRGSGKSYGMGAMLEAFAVTNGSRIGGHRVGRGVLLLDPLDVHWTALQPLASAGPDALVRQYRVLERWRDLEVEPINVQVFVPAGYESDLDPPAFRTYQLPVSDLDAADWAHLLDCDLVNEPRGQLVDEAHRKVTELGWRRAGRVIPAKAVYDVVDLIDCVENDEDVQNFYQAGTVRSVIQPLRSFARMPLFGSSTGAPLTTLVAEGVLSIMCLGRLPAALRTVLTTVIVRKLRADRMQASQIRRRLALLTTNDTTHARLEAELRNHVPRTILAIDEAQIPMPARGSSAARKELDAYVLEGRNYGLSLWMATQRPRGAISSAAASQIDTFIIHRLSVKDDIDSVVGMLQNAEPLKMKLNNKAISLAEVIRSLDTGQAIFSSAMSNVPRFVIGTIRPRMVAHGGEAF
jgi:hypothetical protein